MLEIESTVRLGAFLYIYKFTRSLYLLTMSTYRRGQWSYFSCFDLLDELLEILWIVFFTHSLLLYFYLHHQPHANNFRYSIDNDCFVTFLMILLSFYYNFSGQRFRSSSSLGQLDIFLKDFGRAFVPLDLDVSGSDRSYFEKKKAFYELKYPHVRLHFRFETDQCWFKNPVNPTTNFHGELLSIELIPWDSTRGVSQGTIPFSAHGYVVQDITEVYHEHICPSCRLVLREPVGLLCEHQHCRTCLIVHNRFRIVFFSSCSIEKRFS